MFQNWLKSYHDLPHGDARPEARNFSVTLKGVFPASLVLLPQKKEK